VIARSARIRIARKRLLRVVFGMALLIGLVGANDVTAHARHTRGRSLLLGDRSVEPNGDSVVAGRSEAFALRAERFGKARAAVVYVTSSSRARRVIVALYSNARGDRPGKRLATGSRRHPRGGRWNTISINTVRLRAGRTYWLALLGSRGTLGYRDRRSGHCVSVTTASRNLAAAPLHWHTGASYSDCPVSAYIVGVGSRRKRHKQKQRPPGTPTKPGSGATPTPPAGGTVPPAPPKAPPPKAPSGWPNASDTGANPATVTRVMSGSGMHSVGDGTISNTAINGGLYYTGTGTLTVTNDIIRPDWSNTWATVVSENGGNVVINHTTIQGVNVGNAANPTKGFAMAAGGSLDVSFVNESGICQNNLGEGSVNIHDNYFHDIGSGDATTCHATVIEDESGGALPRVLEHNTMDEFPGQDFRAASDGAVFLQGLYGPISPIKIDDNYMHAAYWSIEISANGSYPVAGPQVTNNCLAWPAQGGSAVSDPNHTISAWSGNTKCDNNGNNTGRPVPKP
jgi:hypothetical protein